MLPKSGLLAPLIHRDFRFLLTSNFLWWQARWMELIVNGWLALEMTDSPWMVALIGFFRSVPTLFVGVFAGPIIDRFGRRAFSLFAQTVALVVTCVVVVLLWLDWLGYWQLAGASLLIGSVWGVDWASRRSLIPDLVGKELSVEAMLLENFVQNLSSIVGPLLSGTFLALFGGMGGYTLIALVSGLALAALLGLSKQPIPKSAMPDGSPPLQRIAAGLQYIRLNQLLIGVMAVTCIMNFLPFPYDSMLPVFARDVLNQGPLGLGILGAASGVGAGIGLFVVNRIRHLFGIQWIFALGSAFFCLALLFFSLSTNFYLSLVLLAVAGVGRVCFAVMQTSIILLTASDEMRSRVMGSLTLFIGAGPFGRLQIGALAENLGASLAVGMQSGVAIILICLMLVWLPGYRQAMVRA
ncbi:MAG: MFS transporter [Chloroflexota bacterium]